MAGHEVSAAVGVRIRRARLERGMSQRELAKMVGVVQAAVSFWECGQRPITVDDLALVAEALGVRRGELLPETSGQGDVGDVGDV